LICALPDWRTASHEYAYSRCKYTVLAKIFVGKAMLISIAMGIIAKNLMRVHVNNSCVLFSLAARVD